MSCLQLQPKQEPDQRPRRFDQARCPYACSNLTRDQSIGVEALCNGGKSVCTAMRMTTTKQHIRHMHRCVESTNRKAEVGKAQAASQQTWSQ